MIELTIISWIMAFLVIGAAIYAIETKDLISAAIAAGVASLVVSIMFLVLQAPDVAITEASIGAGLTMAIFVYAIGRTGRWEE
ncbi:MAG: DUF4040 domain-containing protein [Thermoplasmata archaeon]|nr:MAG: DUF4040 domain-containing protein [Thermoplasmata archaeon]HDH81851.1 DUF4040 domain-containing protein [Thermoplasmatales archaeon]MCD6147571.1 DUF4040 domain-containing protein [Thermoplasmata archaeon]RLF45401.1 MAG: hypothetical protein DRN09_01810 [Thermoplasmata archaeon]RLF62327.1 MAG: hypothetical protein DRN31_04240 [Thermoplasmata archaeon]